MKHIITFALALALATSSAAAPKLNETKDGSECDRQEVYYSPELIKSIGQLYHDKIGLFIHWGPYAQIGGEWEGTRGAEWIMRHAKMPVAAYEDAAARPFNPVRFNAAEWISLCKSAGMGFVVITSKHHDGFAMFDSEHPYNIKDFGGFGRDPLSELHAACQEQGVRFGVYYSQSQDWHEEGGGGNGWQGWPALTKERFEKYYREKALLQVRELVTRFDPLYMIWFDTPGRFMSPEIIEQTMSLANEHQPHVLMNSRIGGGYGHFESASDLGMMPCVNTNGWKNGVKVPWQTHSTVSGPWGYASYRREIHDNPNRSANGHIYSLADIVSKGGVLLLNVAPNELGEIPVGQANVLRRMGQWLEIHGEAIYDADPSPVRNPDLPITSKPGKLYFHIRERQASSVEIRGVTTPLKRCYLLSDSKGKDGSNPSWQKEIQFSQKGDRITIHLPENTFEGAQGLAVVAAEYEGRIAVSDPTRVADANGVITLPVSKSRYGRISMSYDPALGCTHKIAMPWDKGGNTVIWELRIAESGTYKVICHQAFAPALEGARYSIRVNDQVLDADPVVTEHGRVFVPVEVGTVTFDKPADYELRIVMLDGARDKIDAVKDTSGYPREFSIQSIELHKLNENKREREI